MAKADNDDAILAEMLHLAQQLAKTNDALLVGQYEYLRSRIEALIALRGGAPA